MPPALLVYAFEIGVAQQADAAGELSAGPGLLDTLVRFTGHTGSHSASKSALYMRAEGLRTT